MVSSMPRLHFTPGKDPVPIVQKDGRTQGLVWTGGKSRPHRDSIPGRPVRSQSLHRLSYPAHNIILYLPKCKMTQIYNNPPKNHVCQGKMYLSKSKIPPPDSQKKMSVKKKYFTITFVHLIHKHVRFYQSLSVTIFTASAFIFLTLTPNIPILFTAIP